MELLHLQKYIYYYQSEFSRLTTILRYMDLFRHVSICMLNIQKRISILCYCSLLDKALYNIPV